MTSKTKSGYHLNQYVRIKTNWRTNRPDGREGFVKHIWRRYFYSGGSRLMVRIMLGDGSGTVETFPRYIEAVDDF